MPQKQINNEKPHRVQRKRTKGWKMPENTIYVGRPSKFGNPFEIYKDRTAQSCVNEFERWLSHPNRRRLVNEIKSELGGKNLACWCSLDKPCHADILLEIANNERSL